MKFEFKMTRPLNMYGSSWDYDHADCVTHECYHETLSDLREAFDDFLKGCGFYIPDEDIEESTEAEFEHDDEFDGPKDKCPHCHPELKDDEPFSL